MKSLGQFIRERRQALGLRGREVASAVRKADGKPISIPYLVDLEYDRRKPSNPLLKQFAQVLQVDADVLYFLAGRRAPDLPLGRIDTATLSAALRTLRRQLESRWPRCFRCPWTCSTSGRGACPRTLYRPRLEES